MSREIGVAGKWIASHAMQYCDLLTVEIGYDLP